VSKHAFRLRDGHEQLSVGADPRITIAAGDLYETDDPRLARRLEAQPELERVPAKERKPK